VVPRSRVFWRRRGGKLGVAFCGAGLVLVFLGWNGAAGSDRVPSQFPYLISGGIAGLCLVVIGVGMLVVQNQRADRAALQETLRQVRAALEVATSVGNGHGGAPNGEVGQPVRPAPRVPVGSTVFDTAGDEDLAPDVTAVDLEVVADPPQQSRRRRQLKAE
jgi:hypothetical protein